MEFTFLISFRHAMEKIKAADFTINIFSGQINEKKQKDIKIVYIYI